MQNCTSMPCSCKKKSQKYNTTFVWCNICKKWDQELHVCVYAKQCTCSTCITKVLATAYFLYYYRQKHVHVYIYEKLHSHSCWKNVRVGRSNLCNWSQLQFLIPITTTEMDTKICHDLVCFHTYKHSKGTCAFICNKQRKNGRNYMYCFCSLIPIFVVPKTLLKLLPSSADPKRDGKWIQTYFGSNLAYQMC